MHGDEGITLLDALRLSANSRNLLGDAAADIATVSHGEWLRTVFGQLQRPASIAKVKTSRAFTARLRHYQQDGLNWLFSLHRMRLGACLADDMGLGKTVQILALLDALKTRAKKAKKAPASFLVIPASLLANWSEEIENFAPRLSFFIAHPDFHKPKTVPVLPKETLDGLDLVITTYALAQRYEWLQDYTWAYVILDEAQAIKNPGTKQTRAVKRLAAANRIVMTGTPVENRLSDLWSLFDFINPGPIRHRLDRGDRRSAPEPRYRGHAGRSNRFPAYQNLCHCQQAQATGPDQLCRTGRLWEAVIAAGEGQFKDCKERYEDAFYNFFTFLHVPEPFWVDIPLTRSC